MFREQAAHPPHCRELESKADVAGGGRGGLVPHQEKSGLHGGRMANITGAPQNDPGTKAIVDAPSGYEMWRSNVAGSQG